MCQIAYAPSFGFWEEREKEGTANWPHVWRWRTQYWHCVTPSLGKERKMARSIDHICHIRIYQERHAPKKGMRLILNMASQMTASWTRLACHTWVQSIMAQLGGWRIRCHLSLPLLTTPTIDNFLSHPHPPPKNGMSTTIVKSDIWRPVCWIWIM